MTNHTSVYGTPNPALSREEVNAIIERAERDGHNVYFGDGWKNPQTADRAQLVYSSQAPVEMGFWKSITSAVAGWFA